MTAMLLPLSAAAVSRSTAFQRRTCLATSCRVAVGGRDSRERAPRAWLGRTSWMRTWPPSSVAWRPPMEPQEDSGGEEFIV